MKNKYTQILTLISLTKQFMFLINNSKLIFLRDYSIVKHNIVGTCFIIKKNHFFQLNLLLKRLPKKDNLLFYLSYTLNINLIVFYSQHTDQFGNTINKLKIDLKCIVIFKIKVYKLSICCAKSILK